jgi:hypothetical protein
MHHQVIHRDILALITYTHNGKREQRDRWGSIYAVPDEIKINMIQSRRYAH